jgi:multiple sugar transport system permease protein
MVVPMITVINYSLFDNVIMNKNPKFVGLNNYVKILSDNTFWISLYNTIYFTFFSIFFHLIIGLIFAVLLNYKFLNFFVKSILRVVYIVPWLFTATIVAIIWRLVLDPSGIINYLLLSFEIIEERIEWLSSTDTALNAVTFINIWAGYPFYMVSLLAGLQGIPNHLYEAAEIDGANLKQQFINITIPQLKPIIYTLILLDFIWTIQVFPLIWMTTGGGPIHSTEMLSTYTYKLAFAKYKFSLASTSAFLTLMLSLTVSIFYIKKQISRSND